MLKNFRFRSIIYLCFLEDPYPLPTGRDTTIVTKRSPDGEVDSTMVSTWWRITTPPRSRVLLVVDTPNLSSRQLSILGARFPRRSRSTTGPRSLVGRQKYAILFLLLFKFLENFRIFRKKTYYLNNVYFFFCGGECSNTLYFLCRNWTSEARGAIKTQSLCSYGGVCWSNRGSGTLWEGAEPRVIDERCVNDQYGGPSHTHPTSCD